METKAGSHGLETTGNVPEVEKDAPMDEKIEKGQNEEEVEEGYDGKYDEIGDNELEKVQGSFQSIPIPPNRLTPLRNAWKKIYTPIVSEMKVDIRYNNQKKCVELKTNPKTERSDALQKCADFIRAFAAGFEPDDAIVLLRLDNIFMVSFSVTDVKMLHGDHLSRAIGRIAGRGGSVKYTIENATRTRIVLYGSKITILGTTSAIKIAQDAICDLIIGSPPGKVYSRLRTAAQRANLGVGK